MFLTVSSALAVALLVGTGAAIQRQQYKDSLYSFSSFLSGQYSDVINVSNDRSCGSACPVGGEVSSGARGQSECVIVGRYIETADDNGRQFKAYPLYAYPNGDSWLYSFSLDEASHYDTNWNAKTRLSEHSDSAMAILMLRSPITGRLSIRAGSTKYSPSNIAEFANSPATSSRAEICVYDENWLNASRQSVFISGQAGSGDAVTVASATGGCDD